MPSPDVGSRDLLNFIVLVLHDCTFSHRFSNRNLPVAVHYNILRRVSISFCFKSLCVFDLVGVLVLRSGNSILLVFAIAYT